MLSLKVTFFLICLSLPYSKPLLDQTCVSLGYDLIPFSQHGLYVRDSSSNHLVISSGNNNPNFFCKDQFPGWAIGADHASSWSIGGKKYGSETTGNAALSIYKPTLGITVDDRWSKNYLFMIMSIIGP